MKAFKEKFSICLLIGLFLGVLFVVSQIKRVEAVDPPTIAYIYLADTTIASSYESFLESNGYTVDLIHMVNVTSIVFTSYDLVIIGPDTCPTISSAGLWVGNTSQIINSGKPILGIGYGGGAFIDADGGPGLGESTASTASTVSIVNSSHPIFNSPNIIPETPDPTITLVEEDILRLFGNTGHSNVEKLAAYPPSPIYYPIYGWTNATTHYIQFGFNTLPTNMTQTGKNLFINIAYYLAPTSKSSSIPSFQLIYVITSLTMLVFVVRVKFLVPS